MTYKNLFSHRSKQLKSSAIRELLKLTENPNIISFAGGLPAPEGFPIIQLRNAFNQLFEKNPQGALQYSATLGDPLLREWIAHRKSTATNTVNPEQVMIVSGSQQGLDLIGKVFINKGDNILVETPTYLGALQAFSLFSPNFIPLSSDKDGLNASSISEEVAKTAKFIYTQPNFQNPTGRMMSEERRQDLAIKTHDLNMLLIEDDPYGDLWYETPPPPTLLSRVPERVIYMGSFSKILSPGLRLGYIIAPTEIIQELEKAKQATDLHTSTLAQKMVYETVKNGFLDEHLQTIRSRYYKQANAMLEALSSFMPENTSWNTPLGGMFLWLTLPPHVNSHDLLNEATKQNIAYVPGVSFYANNPETNTLRLSFVTVPPEKITIGIKTLGQILKQRRML